MVCNSPPLSCSGEFEGISPKELWGAVGKWRLGGQPKISTKVMTHPSNVGGTLNSKCLCHTYHVPVTVLSTLHISIHLIFTT